MNISHFPKDSLALLRALIDDYHCFSKQVDDRCLLTTQLATPNVASNEQDIVTHITHADWANLSEREACTLVQLVDFMNVARPDVSDHLWREEVAKLSALLRKRYSAAFGTSVYA